MRWVAHVNGKEIEIETEGSPSDGFRVHLGNDDPIALRLVHCDGQRLVLQQGDKVFDVVLTRQQDIFSVQRSGRKLEVQLESYRDHLLKKSGGFEQAGPAVLKAQMPGKIIRVLKVVGETVDAGEGLVIIESMKMQNELKSPKSGQVVKVGVEEGHTVAAGDLLYQVD